MTAKPYFELRSVNYTNTLHYVSQFSRISIFKRFIQYRTHVPQCFSDLQKFDVLDVLDVQATVKTRGLRSPLVCFSAFRQRLSRRVLR